MVTFYSNLCKSKNESNDAIKQYLENIVVTEIDHNDKDMLNKFPPEECRTMVFPLFLNNNCSTLVIHNECGTIVTLISFDKFFKNKSNWLYEFNVIASTLKPFLKKKYNFNIKYKNTNPDSKFCFCSGYNVLSGNKSIFFYTNLIKKKFIKPYYQNEFEINDEQLWKNIYESKIIKIEDTTLTDYIYRLLNNILCNNAYFNNRRRMPMQNARYYIRNL